MWAPTRTSRSATSSDLVRSDQRPQLTPPSRTLPLDAVGHVPWWPAERSEVTLHRVLGPRDCRGAPAIAGHADIMRELMDGTGRSHGAGKQHARTHRGGVGGLPA